VTDLLRTTSPHFFGVESNRRHACPFLAAALGTFSGNGNTRILDASEPKEVANSKVVGEPPPDDWQLFYRECVLKVSI
jgi:hypothetical protein